MKHFLRRSSIRGTLTARLVFGAGVFTVLVALMLDSTITGFLVSRFDEDIANRAQALITLTKEFEEGIELDFAGEFMPEFEAPEGPEYFEVWLGDGSLLERSESLEDLPMPVPHTYTPVPLWQDVSLEDRGHCRVLRISFLPQQEDADIEGALNPDKDPGRAATLLLARKRGAFDRLLTSIHLLVWGSLAGLLLLMIALVRLALRGGLAPLDDIRRQVAAIDLNELDSRIRLGRSVDELAPVVTQLNAMLVRLEAAVVRERRFSSDVAHELRTPLAELRSLSEVGMRDPDDREMVLGFFRDVHDITMEMQHLVTNLLALTRSEAVNLSTVSQAVDLAEIVAKTWQRTQSVAQERRIALQDRLDSRVTVYTDRLMLEQMVQNLINNAVIYSPPGSTVVVAAGKPPNMSLAVTNPVTDLERGDLEHMFDRFWRKDSARTSGKNAGLGLSLVASYARLLGIRIDTRLEDERLSFSLFFPAN